MSKLTFDDQERLEEFDKRFRIVFDSIEKAKTLKEGDYLILYLGRYGGDTNLKLETNSYGAPIKYRVVHTTEYGVPFVKVLTSTGKTTGGLISVVGMVDTDPYRGKSFRFELDPDYADALILQEENFDPAVLHKSKKDIWKAVTDHNKLNKVNTQTINSVVDFFKTVNIGDILWTSHHGRYFVQDKRTLSKEDFGKINRTPRHAVKGPFVIVLTLVDKKGRVTEAAADFFYYKALYKNRPRTYKELNI